MANRHLKAGQHHHPRADHRLMAYQHHHPRAYRCLTAYQYHHPRAYRRLMAYQHHHQTACRRLRARSRRHRKTTEVKRWVRKRWVDWRNRPSDRHRPQRPDSGAQRPESAHRRSPPTGLMGIQCAYEVSLTAVLSNASAARGRQFVASGDERLCDQNPEPALSDVPASISRHAALQPRREAAPTAV